VASFPVASFIGPASVDDCPGIHRRRCLTSGACGTAPLLKFRRLLKQIHLLLAVDQVGKLE
jgi:hypothetical protein